MAGAASAPVPYPSATAPAPVAPAPATTSVVGTPAPAATGDLDIEAIRQIMLDVQTGKATPEEAAALVASRTGANTAGTPTLGLPTADQLAGATTATVDPTVAQGQAVYEKIWGLTPPNGYIESLVKQGLNVFQIELHELSQPGAQRTKYWRDTEADVAAQVAQLMGRR